MAFAYSTLSHYLNQCCNIVNNWTLRNKIQWNLDRNSYIFITENASGNVVCEMAAILFRSDELKLLAHISGANELKWITDGWYTLFRTLGLEGLTYRLLPLRTGDRQDRWDVDAHPQLSLGCLLSFAYSLSVSRKGYLRHAFTCQINSLVPGRFEWNFGWTIFKPISVIDGWVISCEITHGWLSLDLTYG